jgi:spore germination protein YaaH
MAEGSGRDIRRGIIARGEEPDGREFAVLNQARKVRRSAGVRRAGIGVGASLALVAGLLGGVVQPAAADPSTRPLVTGWLPYWATSSATAAVEGNADLIGEASPFWYTAKASGSTVTVASSVGAETIAAVTASLRARGIAIIPSVADGSAARAMAGVLKDPAARAAHVAQLVDLVVANGYDGIELDYEKFAFSDGTSTWSETRPAWVAFVTDLGNALHAAGRKLALAVPPMYDGTRSSTSGYWVYDYAGVAPVVDSLRIMTYDYSVSRPGPIAPLSFLHRTMSYAVTAFPPARIRMGVPAYGRLWTARRADGSPSITGTCPKDGVPGTTSFTSAAAITYLTTVAGGPPTVAFDPVAGESTARFAVQYNGAGADGAPTSCVVDHVAWWVDGQGMATRLPLVAQYGLAGVAAWQLGGVHQPSWDALRAYAQGWTPPQTAVPPTASTTKVSVKPSTTAPKKGKKVTLSVRVSPKKKSVVVKRQMLVNGKWKTMSTKRTNAKGRVTFTFRWPKKVTTNTYRVITTKKGSLPAGASAEFTLTTR